MAGAGLPPGRGSGRVSLLVALAVRTGGKFMEVING